MLPIIPGYRITHTLYESEHSRIYRGWRNADLLPVVLKQFRPLTQLSDELARFEREYEVTRRLQSKHIIRAHALIPHDGNWTMVLEDIGGESLRALRIAGKLPLRDLIALALHICEGLDELHRQHVIHKDLNPSNIILNRDTGELRIIDFGIASQSAKEYATFRHPNMIEGTLAYLSPEQTGRMNREIDFRTDFYSVGATLYELLTGRLPFDSKNALTLVHAHIAKYPAPPREFLSLEHTTPSEIDTLRILSDIIMKLLAKNAEDRYQSPQGILCDLVYCQELLSKGDLPDRASFVVGQRDWSGRFSMPQKLYGRAREINMLLSAFERVATGGMELVVVTGEVGIGKSSAIHEIHKPIAAKQGYFFAGKFDELHCNSAYSAMTEALNQFCDEVLAEPAEEFAAWRQRILAAIGENGQVLLDVIPQLAEIIGSQPPVPVVGLQETEQRFLRTFQHLFQAVCQPDHPMTLFLDDLQWADSASLHALQTLLTDPELRSLLVIVAYRDHDVDEGHPLRRCLNALAQAGVTLNEVRLQPLSPEEVADFTRDTFAVDMPPLSELIFAKTRGNPLFVRQFVQALHESGIVRFDEIARHWVYDMSRLRTMPLADNVAALLSQKLERLPEHSRKTLQLASCLGHRFDFATLASLCDRPASEVFSDLAAASDEDIIIAFEQSLEPHRRWYQFAHDRLRQTAHALIPDAEKPAIHLRIAQLFQQTLSEQEREERLFEVVEHWNAAAGVLTDPADKRMLAELNLSAGKKAKASAAHQAAIAYFSTGIAMTDASDWQSQRAVMFALHDELAEAAYLAADYPVMTQAISVARDHARHVLETVRAHETEILANMTQGKIPDAARIGLSALREIGIIFPEQPTPDDFAAHYGAIQAAMAGRSPMELRTLPAMTHPESVAALRLLVAVYASIFFCRPELIPHLIMKQVALSLQYGNSPFSPFGYAAYGLLLCGPPQEYAISYQFGQLAAQLAQNPASAAIRTHATQMIAFGILPWHISLSTCIAMLRENYDAGMALGDVMYAMYSANTALFYSYYIGRPLDILLKDCQSYLRVSEKQPYVLVRMKFAATIIACMHGDDAEPARSARDLFEERMSVAPFEDSRDVGMQFLFYLNKTYLALLFDQPEESLHYAEIVRQMLSSSIGIYVYPLSFFYDALAQAAVYRLLDAEPQQLARERISAHLQQLARWAEFCPANFAHKRALVQAELHQIDGRFEQALDAYDEAIRLAKSAGFLSEEALANECAAKFWLRKKKAHLASVYLHNARACYQLWGARPKVAQLESTYPEIFLKSLSALRPFKTETSSSSRRVETLDLAALMKAAQTISKEMTLSDLSKQLMVVMLEVAGAEHVSLVLREHGEFILYAECKAASQVKIVSQPVDQTNCLPRHLLEYTLRKHELVMIDNMSADFRFAHDPYVKQYAPKSVLSLPIHHSGRLIGALYFENNLAEGVFVAERVEMLQLLAGQVAISLENARIYARIEQSQERTAELHALNASLREEIAERQRIGEQLQESQELFATFMANLPALAFIMDAEGRTIYVNSSFERRMGTAWISKTPRDMLPEGIAQIMVEDNRKALERGICERIEQVPTTTGEIRSYHTVKFRIERPGNAPLIGGFAIDVTTLKETEAALQESQRLLLMIADNIPAYIAYVDIKSLEYRFVNKQFERFGRPREEVINKHIRQIIGDRNYEFALPYIEQVRAGQRASYENVFTQAVGKVWAQVNYVPAFDDQGNVCGIIVLTHDITPLKQTEEALRESRNLLMTIADNLPAYIAYVDAETLRYKFLNKQFENFGSPCSELIGKEVREVIGEANYALAFPYLEKVRTGEPTVYENEFPLTNGKRLVQVNYVPELGEDGRVRGIVVLGNDITMLKQTEQALRESEKLLLLIADNMPAYIAYADARDFRYRFVNKRYEAFGRPRHEVIGRTFPEIVGESSYRFAKPYLEQVLSGQPTSYENILHFTYGDRWIKVNYVPDIDEQRQVRGIVILSYDITQEKQTAEALQLAKDAAEAANRAKSMFLASMSHELRTPLNAIIGFAQLLAYSTKLPPEMREYVEIIQRSSAHLLALINQVLDLSKIEAGHMMLDEKPMNLFALLDELEEMFWLKAEHKGLRLLFERDEELPCGILADELKLRQVLINLLNNAIKFTSQGDVIVRATRLPTTSAPNISTDAQAIYATLQFSVEDTGTGIAPEELESVFVPFLQTEIGKNAQEGTGLGLPISQRFVQLMGGDIRIESEVGRGSCFTFTIPARLIGNMEKFSTPQLRRVTGIVPDQPCYKILIVDDHAESRALLRNLLTPLGFEIQEAQDGYAAFEISQRWQPDMIWLDVCMPVLDGYETARRIRESEQTTGKHVAIIATSAASGMNDQATALACGCDGFLQKPLKNAEIFDMIQAFLHVQFLYAYEKRPQKHPVSSLSPAMIREALTALPDDLQMALKQAMITADIATITMLAEKIANQDAPLCDAIMERIKQFDYQTFLDVFHSIDSEK
ncbi:multi-sensor signal transduction multi-kinase [Candidatus Moduliflexus flocculans]|uniref:histidine kinase n=1 Tax=Candidatus Moduliflexus flocculans TaxID=1499966 RepID=A0A081BQT4_9BACT|nr:multi-sensor signal transduction multi-kinase [Candidatus Moduliflexus flocculans]